jgi:hypothetical protein
MPYNLLNGLDAKSRWRVILIPLHLLIKKFGVPVHTGHQTHPNRPSDCSRNTSLIDRSETSFARVLDTAHRSHVLGHNREVLGQNVSTARCQVH